MRNRNSLECTAGTAKSMPSRPATLAGPAAAPWPGARPAQPQHVSEPPPPWGPGASSLVPSLGYLRQRHAARASLLAAAPHGSMTSPYDSAEGGGYIAEAKRVLSQAMSAVSSSEMADCETSCSGAIGPLLKYLRDHSGDDLALRPALHTLALIVSNMPNRDIALGFQGAEVLCTILRASSDLEVQENAVQLLWDLGAMRKDCPCCWGDFAALLSVLERTASAGVASHVLFALQHGSEQPECVAELAPEQRQECAMRLVGELRCHRHRLQDAAQYALGAALAGLLHSGAGSGAAPLPPGALRDVALQLAAALGGRAGSEQAQLVLTVLSCLASGGRDLRAALALGGVRPRLLEFGRRAAEPRLRARALSLAKVLAREDLAARGGGGGNASPEGEAVGPVWYFGPGGEDGAASAEEGSGASL